jgi:mannose-6-phosphate isomerase-like protein (cupin superfamily)
MQHYQLADLEARRAATGRMYLEFLRVPALSCGLYTLPSGSVDPQQPHSEDEVYVIMQGKGQIRVGDEDMHVEAGAVVYVAAHVEHRFHSIEEELQILVLFAPAEYSQSNQPRS